MTAVQIWNDETMSQFLNRAYRIVTRKATEADYKLTNIHACLSHVALVSDFIYLVSMIVCFSV